MLIVGTAGWIAPIEITVLPTLIAVVISFAATLAVVPSKSGELGRKNGLVLTLLYIFFISALLIAQ
jgi:Ca2+/Na+ antiporter